MPCHIKFGFVISVFLLYKLSYLTFALRCYTCSYTDTEKNNACLLNPVGNVQITDCNKKYCTIMRQEAVSPAGKVISFIRDCQDTPLFHNPVQTDPTFKTYYRTCVTDLCNDSDGTQSVPHIDPNFGAAENMIIKGKRSSAWNGKISNPLLIECVIITLFGWKYFCQ